MLSLLARFARILRDDLDTPLGLEKATKRRPMFSVPVSPLVAGGLGLFALAFVGSAMLVDNPFGGEPVVIVVSFR
jgi:hypothetical protein